MKTVKRRVIRTTTVPPGTIIHVPVEIASSLDRLGKTEPVDATPPAKYAKPEGKPDAG